MANFDVTLSSLSEAAADIRAKTSDLMDEAQQTLQAAQALSEGWQGDAYEEFISNMQLLQNWMNEMGETLNNYATALDKAGETYSTADGNSASAFKK